MLKCNPACSQLYHTGFNYRHDVFMVAFVITIGNNTLHCVSAVMTVISMVLQKQLLFSRLYLKVVWYCAGGPAEQSAC